MEFIIISAMVALSAGAYLIIQSRKKNAVQPRSGGVYSIKGRSGKYHVIKVLALSKKGYAHYLEYPSELLYRPETLQISIMADRPTHKKAEIRRFHKISPVLIGQIKINTREIQRYLRTKAS
ncbi:MAG: hypothetical protein WBA74_26145 [Cyclobacteriaceae bacterium]